MKPYVHAGDVVTLYWKGTVLHLQKATVTTVSYGKISEGDHIIVRTHRTNDVISFRGRDKLIHEGRESEFQYGHVSIPRTERWNPQPFWIRHCEQLLKEKRGWA